MAVSRRAPDGFRPQWESAPTEFTTRAAVVEIYGPFNSGRTSLALTAPPPILYLYFHEKAEGIIEPFAARKEVKWKKCGGVFRGSETEVQRAAWPAMEDFENHYYAGFDHFRSIIVDTHIEAWELERLAEFGSFKPSGGRVDSNYGQVNARWWSLLNMAQGGTQGGARAKGGEVNVIFIGNVEAEWKNDAKGFGAKTGRKIKSLSSAGEKVFQKSNVSLRTSVSDGGEFSATIEKAWGRNEYMNVEVPVSLEAGDGLPMILGMITGTEQSEWEK